MGKTMTKSFRLPFGLAYLGIVALALLASVTNANADAAPVDGLVNFETPHVHPLDITADGSTLLAVNTQANALEVFDVSTGTPIHLERIPVGHDPVSVRVRSNNEAWVVNHVSDSVSIVDLVARTVIATLDTDNEPADVVFAGAPEQAFVSCSEANTVMVFDPANLGAAPTTIDVDTEDPRAMAVSNDGLEVYVAAFESGNKTTTLNGRSGPISTGEGLGSENIVSRPEGPYSGQNPAPNDGTGFNPPQNSSNPNPPLSSIIVRENAQGEWMDDNNGDWTIFVSGSLASASRRVVGWQLADKDVAVINTATLGVTYQTGLMNLVMAMAVHPTNDDVTVVGTEATNEIRFEPNVNGTFVRVHGASFAPGGSSTIFDLNPHLDYTTSNIPVVDRVQSIGDPRGIAWRSDGSAAFVTGMGSNNLIEIDATGARIREILVGEGPTGIVLSETDNRAYVLNRFAGSVSAVAITSGATVAEQFYLDPTPQAVKDGRPFLYDTHLTSGLGQASCGSCHVDARTDRLAWDLGNPAGSFDSPHHPMKGPMLTQTLQDIIGHPKLHWRGDRDNLGEFNPAFVGLMGADGEISSADMAKFEAFLDTIHFPPSPYRNMDNSIPASILLPDGRTGQTVNALRNSCLGCHTGGGTRSDITNAELAQNFIPPAFHGFYDRLGFFPNLLDDSTNGFGFFHDGADKLFVASRGVNFLADILTIDGPDGHLLQNELRKDVHAGVGQQLTINGPASSAELTLLNDLIAIADADAHAALIAKGRINGEQRGFFWTGSAFQSDKANEVLTSAELLAIAEAGEPITYTLVVEGTEVRLGVDLDNDGVFDGDTTGAPVVTNPGNQTNDEGDSVSLQIQATDPDGDPLTFAASGLPDGLSINVLTGLISGTLTDVSSGTHSVVVTVLDNNGGSDSVGFTWTVNDTIGGGTTVINVPITSGDDDAEERLNGFVALSSGDLEMVFDNSGNQTVGLRFVDLPVPNGATITSAHVQFQVDEVSVVDTVLSIRAEDVNNAAQFVSATNNITNRTTTSAAVTWVPAPWDVVGEAGPDQQTPNIATVIQEVVDRPGWAPNNAMVLIISGTGERVAESANGQNGAEPVLHLEFSTGGTGNQPPVITNPGTQTDEENDTVSLPIVAVDPEGEPLTFAAVGLPESLDIDASTGVIEGVLDGNSAGTYIVVVTATDVEGATDSESFTWIVNPDQTTTTETIQVQIATGNDDVEERVNQSMYMNSSDLELVHDGGGSQVVGLRFVDLDIPQGATIDQANIQFTADETASGTTELKVSIEDSEDAPAFQTNSGNVSSRPLVSDPIAWVPPAWTIVGQSGPDQRTPDLSTIVQEVVDLSGWAPGNAMVFVIQGGGERVAESFEGSASGAARLRITFTVGGGGGNQPPVITNPGTQSNTEGDLVSLAIVASDPDGDPLLFTATNLPDSLDINPSTGVISGVLSDSSAGTYQVTVTANDGNGGSDSETFTWIVEDSQIGSVTIFEKQISNGADDAEERSNLNMILSSSDLEMTFDHSGPQKVGMRFVGVNVPSGAQIQDAFIQFQVDEATSDPTTLDIQAEDIGNAAPFTAIAGDISARTQTSAQVSWQPAPWPVVGQAGLEQRTPNLAALVQEVVNRPDWSPNQAMVFIVEGIGERVAESANGQSGAAPILHIEFTN